MTQDQKDIFIDTMQTGWICGLSHPFECYTNIEIHACNLFVYTDINKRIEEVQDAFIAFFNDSLGPDEDKWDRTYFLEMVTSWYNMQRNKQRC